MVQMKVHACTCLMDATNEVTFQLCKLRSVLCLVSHVEHIDGNVVNIATVKHRSSSMRVSALE